MSRRRVNTRLVLAAIMLGGVLSSAAPVGATGPDSINGLFWKDLNSNGQLGDTDPSQYGAGPESPFEGITVDIDGPSGLLSQTTGPDGLYSFDGLPEGSYLVTATYPTGYRPGALGPDSTISSDAAPAPGSPWSAQTTVVLGAGSEVIVSGAVSPLPILSLDVADLDPGPGVIPAIETGRPGFDTTGTCSTTSDPPTPGDDCSAVDAYVRTNDLTSMTFAVTADNIIDPSTDPLENVVFEQILTSDPNADVLYDSLPPECRTSGVAPASAITANPDGSSVLVCNLGSFANELKLVGLSIKALGSSSNGSSFTTTQRVYQVDDAAIPDVPFPDITTQISAAPRFDITKGTSPENPFNRTVYGQTTRRVNPSTGVEEYGVNYYYDITVLYDGGIVGQESLAGPISFSDQIDPNFDGWVMTRCLNTPYPANRLPADSTAATDWGDRGDWSCTPDYANNEIDIEVTNVDTDGDPVPTRGENGTDLSAGPYVAFAGRVHIWYPLSEFYQQIDPDWTYGDPVVVGDYPLLNSVTQFDPTSRSGVSNYGDATEDEANNTVTTSVPISDRGGFSKHLGSYEWADARVSERFSRVSTWPCNSASDGSLIDGQTGRCNSGDGPTQSGQKASWWYWFRNNGSIPWAAETVMLCDAFDNSTMSLAEWSFGDTIAIRNGGIPAEAIIVEYATGNFGDDVANGDWTNQTAAIESCTAPLDDWTTDPSTLGIDNVGMIRVTIDETIHPEVEPASYVQVATPTEARNTYYGGPNDGEEIATGVILANMANRQFGSTALGTLASNSHLFRPDIYRNAAWGDRLLFNRHQVRIDKRTTRDTPGDDLLEQVSAGQRVMWSLHPAVTAISDGAIANNVTVTDVLPRYIALDRGCQASQPMPPGVTLASITPGPGTGETTLVFELGDREVNQPIGAIPVCTRSDSFAPPSTDVVNRVEIDSDGDVSPASSRSDDRAIRILQTGAFAVDKTVDAPLELQNSTQTWTIGWQNLSQSLPFAPPDAIDVLPYNGDFGNALNGRSEFDSVFSSSIGLTAFMTQPNTNSGGTISETNGTWYYSPTQSAEISHDSRDASNDLTTGTTTWCTEAELIAGAAPCDFALTEVNAIRFVSEDNLLPKQSVSVTYTTAAGLANGAETVSNEPRDRYVNRFAAFSTTFPNQLIRSQDVLVQVLSMSIGDLVFKDVDIDGRYTDGIDQPIAGVEVELHDNSGALVSTTTTDANGRYIFTELLEGQYEVVVPATQFLPGAPLADLITTVLPAAADDNQNEDVDQHARPGDAGSATSGLVSLDPDISGDPPRGFEPIDEDVMGIEDPLTYDNLSNLSVDLGFSGDPAIDLIKQVCILADTSSCDLNDDSHWGESSSTATTIPFDGVFRMTIENTGNVMLTDVQVTDPDVPECSATSATVPELGSILPGARASYSCIGPDLASDIANTASVIATDPGGVQPTDSDEAGIIAPVAAPEIAIVKFVAGDDANTAPGPILTPGEPVVWTYEITNTGNVDFNSIELVDDSGTADPSDDQTPTYDSGDADGDGVLDTGETWVFTLSGTVVPGQYTNVGAVTGTGAWDGETFQASDDDPANYYGAAATIDLVKRVNGQDANTIPGVNLNPGDTASFTYEVTNTGNTHLNEIAVGDDQGVAVTCPATELAPTESMVCTGTDIAVSGQYTNIGDVIGTPVVDDGMGTLIPLTDGTGAPIPKPTDTDPANYFGGGSAVAIVKSVNGNDANNAPGIMLTPGATAEFTYEVTNTGNSALMDLVVSDDQGVVVTCPTDQLAPLETMTCTGSALAIDGPYANIGEVIGTPAVDDGSGTLVELTNPDGTPATKPTDSDAANYFGTAPSVSIVKYVNGDDANTAPGITLNPGDSAEFTYEVTNTGDSSLIDITVSDDRGVAVSCPLNELGPAESMTCTGIDTATPGQYTNIGNVVATPAAPDDSGTLVGLVNPDGSDVPKQTDDDPANYFGSGTGIAIIKRVNGQDANVTPGVALTPGETANFTYEVSNPGNTTLMDIAVTDDQGVEVSCPATELFPGGSMTCTGSAVAVSGQYTNIGEVVATPAVDDGSGTLVELTNPDGSPVDKATNSDPANYFGPEPAMTLTKFVAGHDANDAPGIPLPVGSTVEWTYIVANTGNTYLSGISVTDDQGVAVICPASEVAPGESVTCTGTGVVTGGDYLNVGQATAKPAMSDPDGVVSPLLDPSGAELEPLADEDPANHFGYNDTLEVIKRAFGEDAPAGSEVAIAAGGIAEFTYEVTNRGNVVINDLAVTDDQGVVVTCPVTLLNPGESTMCTGSGPVPAGQYTNIGQATGVPSIDGPDGPSPILDPSTGLPVQPPVATDDANLFGEDPSIELVKLACYQGECGTGLAVPDTQMITWQITVTNTGNVPVENVEITDTTVTACDWSIALLAPGEIVTVNCEALASATRTNSAEVSGTAVSEVTESAGGTPPVIVPEVSSTDTASVAVPEILALTGASSGWLAAAGLTLMAIGAFMVQLARRRREGLT